MTKERLIKILRKSLIIIGIAIVIGALANWYLSHRLNNYLNKTLGKTISEATNGFYTFSFDDFSVGLFNGELSIQGVHLKPDSAVFVKWAEMDSLPKTFFKVDIESIDLKGLNLKWRISYRNLDFSLFEVKSPHIEIFDIYNSKQYSYKTTKFNPRDLYETVSPFLDAVTVQEINFEKAFVSYTVEDSVAATVYKLKDFYFHADGFRLDKNSASSGKLLYCDNFNFSADTPQTLLYNGQLELNTDNIELNTKDSVIQIDNIKITPHISLSAHGGEVTDDYIEAQIKAIAARGVFFKREDALTYLTTRSFDVLSTDIHYYSVVKEKPQEEKKSKEEKIAKADSIIQNWSLYGMVSPILHSIGIGQMKIADAKFKYSIQDKKHVDVYNLEKFDFLANNFKIDSTVNLQNRLLRSDGFILNAIGIHGHIPSKNHELNISGISLNTPARKFEITGININPISRNTRSDYLTGSVESIIFGGLKYNTGLDADSLEIKNPKIDYSMIDSQQQKIGSKKSSNDLDQSDVIRLLEPVISHLSVKNIDIKSADLVFNDKMAGSKYKLYDFDFYATDFLIDENTRLNKNYYFSCENFGLNFYNFDNILPDKSHRLIIKKGMISGIPGKIYLKDVQLTPLISADNSTDNYISINTALIDINGIDYAFNDKGREKKLKIANFNFESPEIEFIKTGNTHTRDKDSTSSSQKQLLQNIDINAVNISNAAFKYSDTTNRDSIETRLGNLYANNLQWSGGNKISAASFTLQKLNADIATSSLNSKFIIDDIKLSGAEWGLQDNKHMNVSNIEINNPLLEYKMVSKVKVDTGSVQNSKDERDFYTKLGDVRKKISIGRFKLSNANGEYLYTFNDSIVRDQMIKKTNIGFEDLAINTDKKSTKISNFNFETKNVSFPLNNGFYTLKTDDIYINQKDSSLRIDNIHLVPRYPKMEFAYKHPTHKDWFDVSSENVTLSGFDLPAYFSDNTVKARNAKIINTDLNNFKNQQIEIEHNIMPLVYEGLQKSPVKFDINKMDIINFSVYYEELAKKGTFPGKIYFRGMNAKVDGFTNITTRPEQYIDLRTTGIFLDRARFEARWMIPVSPENDKFILQGHVHKFDLKELNQIFVPLAAAEVKSGMAQDALFGMVASSEEAVIDMRFLYNDLEINIYKDVEEEKEKMFLTDLANLVIRNNNPRKKGGEPKISHQLKVKRDPYHSTFNYFWQVLRPPLVESVGVSKTTQNVASGISGFFRKVKNFFSPGKKKGGEHGGDSGSIK